VVLSWEIVRPEVRHFHFVNYPHLVGHMAEGVRDLEALSPLSVFISFEVVEGVFLVSSIFVLRELNKHRPDFFDQISLEEGFELFLTVFVKDRLVEVYFLL